MPKSEPRPPLTKKRFEKLLTKVAQPVSEWQHGQAEIETSESHPSDGCIDKRKSQGKSVDKVVKYKEPILAPKYLIAGICFTVAPVVIFLGLFYGLSKWWGILAIAFPLLGLWIATTKRIKSNNPKNKE